MNIKLFYETPMAELILVHFEENILSGEVDSRGVNPGDYHGMNSDEQEW